MESQQMMELLLAMNEKMATKEDRRNDSKNGHNTKAMKTMYEEILSKMEEMMTMNQAKTDWKLKELTETIEKTHNSTTTDDEGHRN
jgi:hypothetical protein